MSEECVVMLPVTPEFLERANADRHLERKATAAIASMCAERGLAPLKPRQVWRGTVEQARLHPDIAQHVAQLPDDLTVVVFKAHTIDMPLRLDLSGVESMTVRHLAWWSAVSTAHTCFRLPRTAGRE